MKKLPTLVLLALIGCGEDPAPKFQFTVINETGLALKLTCTGCQTVNVSIGETLTFGTDTEFAGYTIKSAEPSTKTIEAKETTANRFTVTAYEYEVRYIVTGPATMAKNVEVTYINNFGESSHVPTVEPPVIYEFREFSGTIAQVSAKILSSAGSVRVIIYNKDRLVGDVSATGSGQTATASATIE